MLNTLLDSSFRCDEYKVWTSHRFPVTVAETLGFGDGYVVGSIDGAIKIRVTPVKVSRIVAKDIWDGDINILGLVTFGHTEYTAIPEIDIELLNGSLWTAILTVTEYEKKKDKIKMPLNREVRENYILNF